MTTSYTQQVAFRGRNDDQTLNSTTWTYTENSNWSQDVDTTFRVRLQVEEINSKVETVAGQLEASLNGGTYFNVTTASTIVKAIASTYSINDVSVTPKQLTGSARTLTQGWGCEDGVTLNVSLNNSCLEHEYAVQIVGADVTHGDTITLRIATLDGWTVTPSITVNKVTWTPASDVQSAYVKGSLSAIATPKSAYTGGAVVATTNKSAYCFGIAGIVTNKSAYVVGANVAVTSKAAFMPAGSVVNDNVPAYTEGTSGASEVSDSQPAYVKGLDNTIDNQSAYTRGALSDLSYRDSYVRGSTIITASKNGYVAGGIFINDSQSSYTEGFSTGGDASDSHNAFVLGLDNGLIPDGDVGSSGIWRNELEGLTNLYQSIDEYPTPDINDYIYNTDPTTGYYYETSLSNPAGNIGDGDVVVFWMGKDRSNSGSSMADIQLRQGSTIVASGQQILTATPTIYYFTLTPAQKSSITDWNDLRVRVTVIVL